MTWFAEFTVCGNVALRRLQLNVDLRKLGAQLIDDRIARDILVADQCGRRRLEHRLDAPELRLRLASVGLCLAQLCIECSKTFDLRFRLPGDIRDPVLRLE